MPAARPLKIVVEAKMDKAALAKAFDVPLWLIDPGVKPPLSVRARRWLHAHWTHRFDSVIPAASLGEWHRW
jgi:hypothetical protein